MAKPYSMDLREWVVAAVVEEGMSCHASAARFGVAASSAIKWVRRVRETGSAAPGQMGGHKPNILSGANREWLLARVATDFTLRGLVAELATRGVKVDYVQVWRSVHAEGLSFKKKRAARRTAPARDRPAGSPVRGASELAIIRRIQDKWRARKEQYLELARTQRALVDGAVQPSRIPVQNRNFRGLSAVERALDDLGMLASGSRRRSGTTIGKAVREAHEKAHALVTGRETPTMRAMREYLDSPTQHAIREFLNSPTQRAIREFQNSPTMRAVRELQDSPTMRAARELQAHRRMLDGY